MLKRYESQRHQIGIVRVPIHRWTAVRCPTHSRICKQLIWYELCPIPHKYHPVAFRALIQTCLMHEEQRKHLLVSSMLPQFRWQSHWPMAFRIRQRCMILWVQKSTKTHDKIVSHLCRLSNRLTTPGPADVAEIDCRPIQHLATLSADKSFAIWYSSPCRLSCPGLCQTTGTSHRSASPWNLSPIAPKSKICSTIGQNHENRSINCCCLVLLKLFLVTDLLSCVQAGSFKISVRFEFGFPPPKHELTAFKASP